MMYCVAVYASAGNERRSGAENGGFPSVVHDSLRLSFPDLSRTANRDNICGLLNGPVACCYCFAVGNSAGPGRVSVHHNRPCRGGFYSRSYAYTAGVYRYRTFNLRALESSLIFSSFFLLSMSIISAK